MQAYPGCQGFYPPLWQSVQPKTRAKKINQQKQQNKKINPSANCERRYKQSRITHLIKMLVLPVAKTKNSIWKFLKPFPPLIALYSQNHKTKNTIKSSSNTKPDQNIQSKPYICKPFIKPRGVICRLTISISTRKK